MQAVGAMQSAECGTNYRRFQQNIIGIPNHMPFLPCGYVVTCGKPCRIMAITLIFREFLQCLDYSKACGEVAWSVLPG